MMTYVDKSVEETSETHMKEMTALTEKISTISSEVKSLEETTSSQSVMILENKAASERSMDLTLELERQLDALSDTVADEQAAREDNTKEITLIKDSMREMLDQMVTK